MRGTSSVGRLAAIAAVLLAAVAVVVLLLNRGGDPYLVKLRFQNASQLVNGNLVQVSGNQIGTVESITLTEDGQAEVTAKIEDAYQPLRRGTKATVRATSLSGVANRYIDLQVPPATAPAIASGGVIEQADTTTAVDLDQLFNVFGPRERRSLQGVLKGFAQLYSGREKQANRGLAYLNPSIAATSRLTRELAYDEPGLRSSINRTANLVSDLSTRREDLTALISNLEKTTGAIAERDDELQAALRELPSFMRRANTTFVNLRATLDDVEPLVEESKPVAKKLRPFLAELRPLARDARPTLRDLSTLISTPGEDNDLIEATASNVQVRDAAVRDVERNGETRRGAFPESVDALEGATPQLEFARPYAVDLIGWFDDFSNSGYYDALGSVGRVALNVNAFAIINGLPACPPGAPDLTGPVPGCIPPSQTNPTGAIPLPLAQALCRDGIPGFGSLCDIQSDIFNDVLQINQNNRCPGSLERDFDGSNPYVPPPLKPNEPGGCDPDQVPLGP
jgi:phospholipid/cholesterol/gamma-HCH transport system substrate-binding protein